MIATEPISAPIEVVTPIKPSEAIRLGCLLWPRQAFGYYTDEAGGRCAIGAMAEGFGGDMHKAWRAEDASNDEDCPVADCPSIDDSVIPHLNDTHRWSREQIADWLEGLGL